MIDDYFVIARDVIKNYQTFWRENTGRTRFFFPKYEDIKISNPRMRRLVERKLKEIKETESWQQYFARICESNRMM